MAIEERKPSENETNDQPVAAQATDARAAQGDAAGAAQARQKAKVNL